MKQITIMVDDDQQAHQIVNVLSDFDSIRSIYVDPLWSLDEQNKCAAMIIESEIGPMINHSRVFVHDVMDAHDEGYSIYEIHQIYNLSSSQVQAAFDYIKLHRVKLVPELQKLKAKQAANEAYHRLLVSEREQQIIEEMAPERIKLNQLIEQNRRSRGKA